MSVLPPRAILAGVVVVLALEVANIAPHLSSLAILAVALWMALPGVVLARLLFTRDSSGVAAWLVGPALAFGFSVLGAFVWWTIGIQNWAALLFGPALTWTIAFIVWWVGGPTLASAAFDRRDVAAVALALLVVPAVTWAPYDHVREPVPDGEAYRAYFTADFVWAMTVSSEIARGDVPPQNPFLRDEPLHYYWLAHFLSGSVYRNVRSLGAQLEAVVLLNGLVFCLAFVAFMYALARFVGAGPWASAIAVAVGFLANSYEGADMIRAVVQHGQPWSELANTNIDAVTRWFYHGMAVDGLQRLFLYQPHHLTGYALAFAAVWLVGLAEDVSEVGVSLGAGVLLGMALLFSTFGALIMGLAVGLLYGVRLLQQRRGVVSALQCAILGGVPVVVGVALTSTLGYTDERYGLLLQLGLNPVAVHSAARVWFLSFGPLLLGATAALVRIHWLQREGAPAVAVVCAATAFYFFTNVPDSGDVWVGWRSGHLLLIAFAVMCGALWTALWHRRLRVTTLVITAVAVALAVPTVAIDVYNAQDITNRTEGPTFPWTIVITPEERAALDWVRTSTPPDAVVQVEPYSRGAAHWSYIGAFAERRSIAGLPGSMIPMHPYRHASDDLWEGVFHVGTAQESHAMARFLGVDYLFIGAVERHQFREVVDRLAAAPDLFPIVFKNMAVTIFAVAPLGPGPPPRDMLAPVRR